ncbi:unnamed protein product [Closterium sp. Naga37s-1]|nr:unnamed protein product [Closterium sp. Naga37s-1]
MKGNGGSIERVGTSSGGGNGSGSGSGGGSGGGGGIGGVGGTGGSGDGSGDSVGDGSDNGGVGGSCTRAQGAGTASSTSPEQRPPSPPPARTRSAAGSVRQGSAAQSCGSAAPTPSPRSTNNVLHRASAAPTGKGRSSSAPLPTAGPTRPGPAARPKVGKGPSEGRDQERLVDAQANPIHGGRGDGEEGTRRQSAGRLARGDADVGVAAKEVAPAEQGLQQAAVEERREAQLVQEAPSGAARTRAVAAAAALGSPPVPAATAAAAGVQARKQLTAPPAEGPSPTPTRSAAATSQTGTLGAGAAVAGTAPPGSEGTDPVVGTPAAHTGAGDEAGGGGGRIAREAVVGEVPVLEKSGASVGEEPVREEEAGRQRRQPRPQLHPRRLGAGLGLARPGPLAGWEQQEDLPDGPAAGEDVACPSSGVVADGTQGAGADLAVGADLEDVLERRGEAAERRRQSGTSRQRALQDQADDRAAGLQPTNAAPRAAGRGRGRGRNGGRARRDLAGAVAREKARSGNWRERHGRPEEQGEGPMNEGEGEEGSEYMASQEADSEEESLDAEQGVPIPATERGQGSGQGRREGRADVGESAPQQPNVAASKERNPSVVVDDEDIWQRIHAWDLGPLQSSAQPFLVRKLPPEILNAFCRCLTLPLLRLSKHPNCLGAWRLLQYLPRLKLRASLEKVPGNRWAEVEKRLRQFREEEWDTLYLQASTFPANSKPSRHEPDPEGICARAEGLVRKANLAKAVAALQTTPLAEPSLATLQALRSKHPEAESAIPAGAGGYTTSSLAISAESFREVLAKCPNGIGAGPSGTCFEHLRDPALTNGEIFTLLHGTVNHLLGTYQSEQLHDLVLPARLIALDKPGGGVRPIAIGEAILRLTAKAALKELSAEIRAYFLPVQFGVAVPGGAECIIHTARTLLAEDPSRIALQLDIENAFNSVERGCFLESMR